MEKATETPPPLTRLTEDETLFRDSVLEFARREIQPLVREMDDQAKMSARAGRPAVRAGRDGHRDPRNAMAARGATFFHSVLAVEALSSVDPSVGVLVDVQNTLVVNALLRWGDRRPQGAIPAAARDTSAVGAYALSEAGSGSDAFALTTRAVEAGGRVPAHRPQALDHQCAMKPTCSSSLPR